MLFYIIFGRLFWEQVYDRVVGSKHMLLCIHWCMGCHEDENGKGGGREYIVGARREVRHR